MKPVIEMHDVDIKHLIQTLDACVGDVYLETPEGDHLNLKSKLCQLTGLTTLLESGRISEAVIRCDNPEDESKLFRLNLYKEVPDKEE